MTDPPAAASTLLEEIANRLRDAGLASGDTVVAGFSAGPDSLALLWGLATLERQGRGPHVVALHVDHQLRPDSARDAERALALGSDIGVSVEVEQVDVAAWPEYPSEGTEAAARAARYAALGRLARRHGTSWVAVAHTRDDQAETVLLRLLRGASLEGLAGMRPITRRRVRLDPTGHDVIELTILRPLLGLRREAVTACLAALGLTPVEDPTNWQLEYRRNRLRHQVMPLLEQISPGATEVIARVAEVLQDDAACLEAEAAQQAAILVRHEGTVARVDRAGLASLPLAIQRRVLIAAVLRASDEQLVPTFERLEALRTGAERGRVGTRIELGRGWEAIIEYNAATIGPAGRLEEALRRESGVPLLEPGTSIDLVGSAEIALGNRWRLRYRTAVEGWVLRTRRPGDRLLLSPDRPPVRLQDWLVNRKVPAYLRDWLPLLADGRVVWWIGGLMGRSFSHPQGLIEVELVREPVGLTTRERGFTVQDDRVLAEKLGLERVLIDEETLQRRVGELGQEITGYYQGKRPLLIGVLTGAFVFMADLVRHMPIPLSIDFMAVSSYGQATVTSGVVRIIKDLDRPIEGEHILLVEDIVDSGLTLKYLSDVLRRRNPASFKVVALLRKQKAGALEVPIDWVGFDIPDEFVVGYGLDVAGKFRNLPFVAVYRGQ
ncbi:hypoxanthine phosphoribosyltransferase [Thermomicrobiaceae bacterium CFH 74404]|uniref:tRNA(Ile)-lysidine synthase n=1 Tax=Thermalbibacter longus TaxID=2951981 RepID=A0AA41WCL9_9BACT|nr:hypoxanthine phosphoribosyltransferase [Thermalbibacter longus]MCM8748029.1 hypoxanthine phosphoribosyltransferase [Thermalbibacter longus]